MWNVVGVFFQDAIHKWLRAWTEDDLHPTAQAPQACVRAAARRAAGPDGWTPKHLARLPLDFYELLARL